MKTKEQIQEEISKLTVLIDQDIKEDSLTQLEFMTLHNRRSVLRWVIDWKD